MKNKINTFKLRQWLAKTKRLSLEQKRHFLGNFDELNPSQLQELYAFSKTKKSDEPTKVIDTYVGKKIKGLVKIILIFSIPILIWNTYSTPYGISILSFPGSIWQTRQSLNLLKKELPSYHDLVINNIDILSFKYIEVSGRHDGYAQMTDDGIIKVSLLTQHKVTPPYLAGALVHEACHGKQFHDKRINMRASLEKEPRQKIEHECLLLQIHTMETLKDDPSTIKYFKNTGHGTGIYGDTWLSAWKGGDTSMGLMDLLPKDKRTEWNVPGFEKDGIKKTKESKKREENIDNKDKAEENPNNKTKSIESSKESESLIKDETPITNKEYEDPKEKIDDI